MTTRTLAAARGPGTARPRHGRLLAVVCAANFLVLADATIVNVALPSAGRALGLRVLALTWVVNGYSFAFGGCLLPGGWVAGMLGPRRALATGMAVFALGSLGCGLAGCGLGGGALLLAGRVVQGTGGALACPAAMSVITVTFPGPASRVRALAIWSAAGAAAVASGPLLGGALTGLLGWPSVFLVPVPVCAVAAAGGLRWLPGRPSHPGRDGPGGPRLRSAARRGLAALRRVAAAPPVVAADAVLALSSGALVAACYAGTMWVQDILHRGPLLAGLALLPLSAGLVAGSAVAPALVRRAGVRPVTAGGLAVAAGALALLATVPVTAGLAGLIPPLTLAAAGFGVQSVPVSFAATAVPGQEALASALYQAAGQLGGGGGLAVLAAVAAAAAGGTADGTGAGPAGGSAGMALAAGLGVMFAGSAVALALAWLVALLLPSRSAGPS